MSEITVYFTEAELEVLDGAVDLHIHPGPSVSDRSVDVRLAYQQAMAANMAAIGFKSHYHSMATDVAASLPEGDRALKVLTGVTLGDYTGGLNPYAVELSFAMGGEIVWLPTLSSAAHMREAGKVKFPATRVPLRAPSHVPVMDQQGRALPELLEVLRLVGENDGLLCFGHEDADTIDALLPLARTEFGIERILILHPNYIVGASPERAAEWGRMGAMIEHSVCMYINSSSLKSFEINSLVAYIETVGPQATLLGSDLGQQENPVPAKGFAELVLELRAAGVDDETLNTITRTNGRQLARV